MLLLIFTPVIFGLGVAIWAKQLQVSDSMVIINTIDMMKLQRNGLVAPSS
jgi:hypothetical protein